jgi:RNA polymerase sigma-70 factor (ECF subfamily)
VAHADGKLARRILEGEERAVGEFFDRYFPGLFRFASSRLGADSDHAEEIVQLTLCRAISKLDTYRGQSGLFTWLCTFCRNEISAFYQRRRRMPQEIDLADETTEIRDALQANLGDFGEDPATSLGRKELAQAVRNVLERLPGSYGDVLEWKYIEGAPVTEIASRLGVTAKAAESALSRARLAFRKGFSISNGRSSSTDGTDALAARTERTVDE